MSEIQTLTTEELDSIKNLQKKYNTVIFELGSIEAQLTTIYKQTQELEAEKKNVIVDLEKIGETEKEVIDALQVKYGAGNINIETGEVTSF